MPLSIFASIDPRHYSICSMPPPLFQKAGVSSRRLLIIHRPPTTPTSRHEMPCCFRCRRQADAIIHAHAPGRSHMTTFLPPPISDRNPIATRQRQPSIAQLSLFFFFFADIAAALRRWLSMLLLLLKPKPCSTERSTERQARNPRTLVFAHRRISQHVFTRAFLMPLVLMLRTLLQAATQRAKPALSLRRAELEARCRAAHAHSATVPHTPNILHHAMNQPVACRHLPGCHECQP